MIDRLITTIIGCEKLLWKTTTIIALSIADTVTEWCEPFLSIRTAAIGAFDDDDYDDCS